VWLDPMLAKVEATNIAEALKAQDPANAQYYDQRLTDFKNRVDVAMFGPELLKLVGIQKLTRLEMSGQLIDFLTNNKLGNEPLISKAGGWLKATESLRGVNVFEFHKIWVYFARAVGFHVVGTVEERPGIPPGPQHVREITEKIKTDKIPLILVDNFYDPSLPNNICRETGCTVVVLPNQVEGEPNVKTYFDLIDTIISKISAAQKKG